MKKRHGFFIEYGKIFLAFILLMLLFFVVFNNDYEADGDFLNELYAENDKLPDDENIGYAIIGVTAPEDILDFHNYGLSMVNDALISHREIGNVGIPSFTPNHNEIEIVYSNKELVCWWELEAHKQKNCMADADIDALIKNNEKLLSRYFRFHKYNKIHLDVSLSRNDNIIIPLHNIFMSYLNRLIRNNEFDLLYRYLFDDIKLWKNLANQRVSWIEKAIIIKVLHDDLKLMELLINRGKPAFKITKNMKTIFSEITPGGWALKETYILEYRLTELKLCLDDSYDYINSRTCLNSASHIFYKKNMTINKIHTHIDSLMEIANSNRNKQLEHCSRADGISVSRLGDSLKTFIFNYKGHKVFEAFSNYSSLNNLCSFLSAVDRVDLRFQAIERSIQIERPDQAG